MPEKASEKVDILDALKTGLLTTSSLGFGLGAIYTLAYFDMMGIGVLRNISFLFILISMLIVFNITFSLSLVDQLRS